MQELTHFVSSSGLPIDTEVCGDSGALDSASSFLTSFIGHSGTSAKTERELVKIVETNFDLRPGTRLLMCVWDRLESAAQRFKQSVNTLANTS